MKQIGDIRFYDVQEIAKAFDMTPQSIRKFLREGRIKARKFGTRWYVTEEAMREYLLGYDNEPKKEGANKEVPEK
jgi:phage antirepressor YoqD-like protein